jgi:ferric-dicitrate binding protein FerR (iron transport regulator)
MNDLKDESAFEAALRRALRRESPSTQFAERVRGRIEVRRRKRATRYWMAVAAMVALSVGAGTAVHDYETQRQAKATKAGEELVIALKITSSKLHATQKMIRRRTNAI